ncbi:unnamed protein product [Effrenium voratum]|nr:unnamed protein product [Effrenium voratum]
MRPSFARVIREKEKADLKEDLELSDVSFLSRDRDLLDYTEEKEFSDSEDDVSRGRRKAIICSCAFFAACVFFGAFVAMGGSGAQKIWTSSSAWGSPGEDFPLLGQGLCIGLYGMLIPKYNTSDSDVLSLFSDSDDCRASCAADDQCTGYVTKDDGGCSLILKEDGMLPAAADGDERFQCFWRRRWLHDSVGVYNPPRPLVPKVIWSYWEDLQVPFNKTLQERAHQGLAFRNLCQSSWRKLNPGWEVRMLDQDTMWNYIALEDLPKGFHALKIWHRSDAIRLALVAKHGGVWLDATTLLLRPFSTVIQDTDPGHRIFYVNRGLKGQPLINPSLAEKRVTAELHVENWFFAAPPQDPFLVRTLSCVKRLHRESDTKLLAEYPDMFTARQQENLLALGIWEYLATDACLFKVLDEDKALKEWWLGPSVTRRNLLGHLNPRWWSNPDETVKELFRRVDPELVQTLTGGALLLLKFTGPMRDKLIDPLSPLELYGCVESSWSIALTALQLFNATKCIQLRLPGANFWL